MLPPRWLRPDTKTQELAGRIRQLAEIKGPNKKLPTARELCAFFDVSQGTLNDVLDMLEAQNVLYRKQGSGIYVSPLLHRKTIFILQNASMLEGSCSPLWGNLWNLFVQRAKRRMETLNEYYIFHTIIQSPNEPLTFSEEIATMIQAHRFHAVLSLGVSMPQDHSYISKRIPWVAYSAGGDSIVVQDYDAFICMAVQTLVEQGCRSIGLWVPFWDNTTPLEEQESKLFAQLMTERGLSFDPHLVRSKQTLVSTLPRKGYSLQEQGYQIAMEVFGNTENQPDGIIILDDMMTDGALSALHVLGIRLGDKLKWVTHSNADTMLVFNYIPGLTVIEFAPTEVVDTMFKSLDVLLTAQPPVSPIIKITPRFRKQPSS